MQPTVSSKPDQFVSLLAELYAMESCALEHGTGVVDLLTGHIIRTEPGQLSDDLLLLELPSGKQMEVMAVKIVEAYVVRHVQAVVVREGGEYVRHYKRYADLIARLTVAATL